MGAYGDVHASGVVIPCEWDDERRVCAISLSTTGEQELRVNEQNGRGAELRAWIHRRLRVSGYLDTLGSLVVLDFQPDEEA